MLKIDMNKNNFEVQSQSQTYILASKDNLNSKSSQTGKYLIAILGLEFFRARS